MKKGKVWRENTGKSLNAMMTWNKGRTLEFSRCRTLLRLVVISYTNVSILNLEKVSRYLQVRIFKNPASGIPATTMCRENSGKIPNTMTICNKGITLELSRNPTFLLMKEWSSLAWLLPATNCSIFHSI